MLLWNKDVALKIKLHACRILKKKCRNIGVAKKRRITIKCVDSLRFIKKAERRTAAGVWACVVWLIWKARNDIIFKDESWKAKIAVEVSAQTWSWFAWNKKVNRGVVNFSG